VIAPVHPLVAALAVGSIAVTGAYVVAVLDGAIGSAVAGRGLEPGRAVTGPIRRTALLLLQHRAETERPDRQAWALAPALLAGLAALGVAAVPLGPRLAVADTSTGFVVFAVAVGYVLVAVYLHGWSANSTLPLIGGYRFIAQALSFQMPFLLALLATCLPAESLAVSEIVRAQESMWNVVRQPAGLPLFLIVGAAVSFWGPLNLPDAPDLAGGTSSEVSGAARLLWLGARGSMQVAVAAMGAASFLGGWWGPWLPGPVWMVLKTLALLALLVSSRHLLARVRIERFVVFAWALLIPLALVNVLVSGLFLL
jgi:NADH-quinone oxidoreductase subunit H